MKADSRSAITFTQLQCPQVQAARAHKERARRKTFQKKPILIAALGTTQSSSALLLHKQTCQYIFHIQSSIDKVQQLLLWRKDVGGTAEHIRFPSSKPRQIHQGTLVCPFYAASTVAFSETRRLKVLFSHSGGRGTGASTSTYH